MKSVFNYFLLTAISITSAFSQNFNYVFLKPDSTEGKDAVIPWHSPDDNHATNPSFHITAWTYSGQPTITRCLIDFDLSGIPQGSFIAKATLKLFYNYNSGFNNNIQEGNNNGTVYRITETWNEYTLTWNNQPAFTTSGSIPFGTTATVDEGLTIDVTDMLQVFIDSPSVSHGFLFKLDSEVSYADRLLASSDHEDCRVHPELFVVYTDSSFTGIQNSDNEETGMKVYPNPTDGYISVETNFTANEKGRIEIVDMNGKVLSSSEIFHKQERINISDFEKGVYVICLYKGNNLLTRKLLKI